MKKIALSLSLALSLLAPLALRADDHDRHDRDHDDHRFYDKKHRDYHNFDDHEDRAWRMYWQQHHHDYIAWDRASARQQQDYWNWRHSHSDAILQINIR